MRWDSIGALGGAIFVVLVIISFVVGGEPPDVGDPVTEIVDFWADNETSIYIGNGIGVLAVLFFLIFANHLRRMFAAAGDAPLATLVLVGAAIMTVGFAVDGTISLALAEEAENLDPTSVQTLQALWDNDWLPMAVGLAVFLISTGVSIIQTGLLPKWLGWIALLLFVLSFTPAGFVAFLAGAVLIIVISVMLALRGDRAPAATTPPPAAPPPATG